MTDKEILKNAFRKVKLRHKDMSLSSTYGEFDDWDDYSVVIEDDSTQAYCEFMFDQYGKFQGVTIR